MQIVLCQINESFKKQATNLFQLSLRCFVANCALSRITRFLCYFSGPNLRPCYFCMLFHLCLLHSSQLITGRLTSCDCERSGLETTLVSNQCLHWSSNQRLHWFSNQCLYWLPNQWLHVRDFFTPPLAFLRIDKTEQVWPGLV